jgi:AhpD family alkylhydroperoxidase
MRINTYRIDGEGYQCLLAWNEHLAHGPLSESMRALVETRVSQINGCTFCLAMHADEARQAGVPQAKLDTIAAWRDSSSFTEEERAALQLAEAMTRVADGGRVDDVVWASAAKHFDEPALAALLQVIAMINAFNRINVATERTDADYHRLIERSRPAG